MIITISGVPGSGKTSVAKIIAEKLDMPFYSVGALRGKMAMEKGMTLDELNALGETDSSTDTLADDYQKELGAKEDNFVIEGRLSWHFIPKSYKVFLDCRPAEAAQRILASKNERPDEKLTSDPEQIQTTLEARLASDIRRYQKIYGIDYMDPKHYDLVIDTTLLKSAKETAELVFASLKPRLDSQGASM
jgi:cytidylate kinase